MPETIPTPQLPTNDLQYVIYAVAFTVAVIWLGTLYLRLKYRAKPEDEEGVGAGITKEDLTNAMMSVTAQVKEIKDDLKEHTKREEDRFAAIERKMDEGFRGLHERIDRHIEAHRTAN